jgi:hypothetical protein
MADSHHQDALCKRHILPYCDLLLQNRRDMPSIRSEPRTIEQARYQERHSRESTHDSCGGVDGCFGVQSGFSLDTVLARVHFRGASPSSRSLLGHLLTV